MAPDLMVKLRDSSGSEMTADYTSPGLPLTPRVSLSFSEAIITSATGLQGLPLRYEGLMDLWGYI